LISFDLDGVLQHSPFRWSSPDGVFGEIKRELVPYASIADPEQAARAVLALVDREHQGRLHSGQLVAAHDWDGIIALVANQLGYPGRLAVAEIMTRHCENPRLCEAYAGARECLQTMADRGHTLVAITNGYRSYQEPVLRKLGLLGFFKALITPEAVGAAKPEPGIFRAAQAYGDGSPGIHIGDVLTHDIAGAKRAGWQAVYVVQKGAPGATELPPELAALPPRERPQHGLDWLKFRLDRDRKFHGWPPADLADCIPDAIVSHLSEIPEFL
jgi:HAD superfamily hydrolase (TIGR01549 family)